MNRIVFLLLLIVLSTKTYSLKLEQDTEQKPTNEKVTLFTDRNLFSEGETIQFAAHVKSNGNINSSVLYVELVSENGNQIEAEKFKVENHIVKGLIKIPAQVPSGSYFIKAYTRWMRNFEPTEYSYTQILVFNPKEDFTVSHKTEEKGKSVDFIPVDTSAKTINISTDKTIYSPREKAILKVNVDNKDVKWLTATIAPKASLINQVSKYEDLNKANNKLYFNAEDNGFTLSAKVLDSKTNKPATYNLVNVSILSPNPDFLASRTDSSGSFSVCLPEKYGNYDLYVGIEEGLNSTVNFDNDFCTRRVTINSPISIPTTEQINTAKNIVNNNLINSHFNNPRKEKADTTSKDSNETTPFYGTPDITFIFDDYVDLLSVREYFYELLPVSVKETENQTYFKIFGNYPEFDIYKPLIIVDNIVIDDARRILSAKPEFIDRVEIITKPYFKGDMVYGGIISFYSKAGDFARIELSRTDMFITYKFFSEFQSLKHQDIKKDKPDTRNTIFWEGSLDINAKNLEYSITVPDTRDDYEILLRGVDIYGEVVYSSLVFSVR